jgi:hypothetical protein
VHTAERKMAATTAAPAAKAAMPTAVQPGHFTRGVLKLETSEKKQVSSGRCQGSLV